MTSTISILIRVLFLFLIDLYAYQAFKTVFPDKPAVKIGYWVFHLVLYIGTGILLPMLFNGSVKPSHIFLIFSGIIALYVPKMLISLVLGVEDITRLFRFIASFFTQNELIAANGHKISRARFLSQTALVLGAIPFIAIINGIIRTKYNYQINKIKIPILNLPTEFEGFTITQISDLHSGSYDDLDAVSHGMDLVNAQNSDIIVFTGDLINFNINEVEGFQPIYSKLKSKEGVLAILGNHDYYYTNREADKAEKDAHFEKVTSTHATYGWKLLRNENHIIQRGQAKLAMLGVDNWGKGPYFPKEGKLDLAIKGAENADVKVLLSHDPSHWDAIVRPEFPGVHLTLSGHTHGFQFGIEIPGFKFSPAQWMYPQWAGLYSEGEQHLYVNRGFGFLGFSGRVGIRPEITVLELVRA